MTDKDFFIHESSYVDEGVTLEDDVFCGPSMVFTNVFNPRAHVRKMDFLFDFF